MISHETVAQLSKEKILTIAREHQKGIMVPELSKKFELTEYVLRSLLKKLGIYVKAKHMPSKDLIEEVKKELNVK